MNPGDLEDLLADFVERRDRGEDLGVDAFCAAHRAAGPELRQALEALGGTESALPVSDSMLPERIGDWRVLGLVSRGGMGRVLRVTKDGAGAPVRALKLLGDASFANPRAHERLRREGEVLIGLDVPGVVRCHEVGFAGDTPYLVMDLVEGKSLGEVAADTFEAGRDHEGIARFVAKLARSVQALHDAGLLHRDLKPSNVLVDTATDEPVLIDFGLAGGEAFATLTRSGDVLGTPAYMAPEQARGERVGPAADVFGLGAILFELLTGQPPRAGRDSLSVLEEVRTHRVPSVRRVHRATPKALAAVCRKALAFAPRFRYASARALAADLDAFAAGTTPVAGAVPLRQRVAEAWQFHRTAVMTTAAVVAVTLTLELANHGPSPVELRRNEAAVLDAFVDGDRVALASALERGTAPAARVVGWIAAGKPVPPAASDYERALFEGCTKLKAKDASARAALSRAAALGPNAVAPIFLRGIAAEAGGDQAVARRDLQTAVRMLPESVVAHRRLAHVMRKLGELAEAERVLDAGLELDDRDAGLWDERARLCFVEQRYAEGVAAIERAIKIAGHAATAQMRNTHAILLDGAGRHADAARVYRKLIAADPGYVTAIYNRARTIDSECRLAEARRVYEQAVRADPRYIDAHVALAWLESGSNRAECDKCQAAFAANPALYDTGAAEGHLLEAVRLSGGKSSRVLGTAVAIAKRLGRKAKLRALLEDLRDRDGISDRRLGRLTRALRGLAKN